MSAPSKKLSAVILALLVTFLFMNATAGAVPEDSIYDMGILKPTDSQLNVEAGDQAIDFSLPSLSGEKVSLSGYRGKKNVVIAFIPAAWTPVCSNQLNGYTYLEDVFDQDEAVLLAISTDNIPTLYAWTREMLNLWFPVLSDFSPHGAVAQKYGVFRPEGIPERAIFVVNKDGIIVYIDVHDINTQPDNQEILKVLEMLSLEKPDVNAEKNIP